MVKTCNRKPGGYKSQYLSQTQSENFMNSKQLESTRPQADPLRKMSLQTRLDPGYVEL